MPAERATEFNRDDDFRGASFLGVDASGATFRDCDVSEVRIVGSDLTGLRVSGFTRGAGVVVDDVDVSSFVAAELDRRHPERVQRRQARTAAELRTVRATVERLWSETRARAERLPEDLRHERVEDEWSFVETLRHLVAATDIWLGRMIRLEERPFHPAGLPPTDYPPGSAAAVGLDLALRPTYAEAVAVHLDRQTQVRRFLDAATDAALDEMRTAVPLPAWGERSRSVRECLGVLLDEYVEHRRFALRDLAVLEARPAE